MYSPSSKRVDKSSAEYHQRTYRVFREFMDRTKYGSMILLLKEKNIPDTTARRRAGLDIVDIVSIGTDPADPQTLHIHSRKQGDSVVVLEHTYMYWAQLVTLSEFLEEHYGVHIPKLSYPKKDNGLLSCVELDGAHMAKLPNGYITWTFKLRERKKHACIEETAHTPANTVVRTGELGGIVCPFCIAEELNINI